MSILYSANHWAPPTDQAPVTVEATYELQDGHKASYHLEIHYNVDGSMVGGGGTLEDVPDDETAERKVLYKLVNLMANQLARFTKGGTRDS